MVSSEDLAPRGSPATRANGGGAEMENEVRFESHQDQYTTPSEAPLASPMGFLASSNEALTSFLFGF